jgi:hypothetical protein
MDMPKSRFLRLLPGSLAKPSHTFRFLIGRADPPSSG